MYFRWVIPLILMLDRLSDRKTREDTEMKAYAFVRIPCRSRADAKELARRLKADDYRVVRRWNAVIAGTETREEADQLGRRLQAWADPRSALIWETAPRNQAAIFAGLADAGS